MIEAPQELRERYSEWTWSLAQEPWPASATWRLSHPDRGVCYLKVGDRDHYPTPIAECERLQWASDFLPVPSVVESGGSDGVDWVVTRALPGLDATKHPFREDPERIVSALASALASFHRSSPVESCPFDFRLEAALAHVRARVDAGQIHPARDFNEGHQHLSLDEAVALLATASPEREDLVVCHGDYCPPNIVFDKGGELVGYLDLGELAVADRWWDVAVGAWSATWNYGAGYEDLFYSVRHQPGPGTNRLLPAPLRPRLLSSDASISTHPSGAGQVRFAG